MNDREAVRQMMATMRLEGFVYDAESLAIWEKVANGEITTDDVRKMVYEKLDRLKRE